MLLYLALCTGANGKKVPWTPVLKQRSRDSQLAEFCWPCLKRVWWVPEDLFGWKVNVPQGSIPEGTSLQAEGSAKYGRTAAITFHMSQLHVGGTQRQVTMGNMLVLITKLWKCVLHPLFFYFLAVFCVFFHSECSIRLCERLLIHSAWLTLNSSICWTATKQLTYKNPLCLPMMPLSFLFQNCLFILWNNLRQPRCGAE